METLPRMMKSETRIELRPQKGPQEAFLRSSADICVFGGSAGSSKSFSLLLDQVYHVENPNYRGVIFRRTIPMIRQPGGLWDTSASIYAPLGAASHEQLLEWRFPSGAVVKFAGLETEADVFGWQGAQIAGLAFDEFSEFTERQFWFLLSRNRSTSGVRPFVRAATNPTPDGWLRNFIAWWIDDQTGLPLRERSGVLRYFVRVGDELHWSHTRDELRQRFGADSEPKSVTFIPASVHDNRALLDRDPGYLATLKALPLVDRARLLDGNWNIRASAGLFFRREWFEVVDGVPENIISRCRFWDRAATPKSSGGDPDATVGVRLARDSHGVFYVEHVHKMFASPFQVENAMKQFAQSDPPGTLVAYHQDPGSAGVAEAQATARALAGFNVQFNTATGDKASRARPASAQTEAGNVKVVRGSWNMDFFRVLEAFPDGAHDDEVDAFSGAFEKLISLRRIVLV
jgi:predicted phage terminase large subunit-like protein